jgi:GNAT superfamily N-acetyltransferase
MTSRIRRARREEADALRELAHRSKGYWGYDDAFMSAAMALWHMGPDEVASHEVHVLEIDGRITGWHRVTLNQFHAELEDLWVEPPAIGQGHGRTLFEHAVGVARAAGAERLEWDADPNAEPFYRAMGGEVIGQTASDVVGDRQLPRMRLSFAARRRTASE